MSVDHGVAGVAEAPEAPLAPPHRWTDTEPHPWRRYFARSVDLAIVSLIGLWLLVFLVALLAPPAHAQTADTPNASGGEFVLAVMALLLSIPVNSLTIGVSGGSVGKWIFGVKVLRPDGRPIGVWAALVRELKVLLFGYGLLIPLVNLGTMIWSFMYLADKGHTQWDRPGRILVVYRPWGRLHWTIAMTVLGLIVAGSLLEIALDVMRS